MGERDSKAKEYFGDNRRFADLCNFYMYDGDQIIHPGDLREKDTTEVLSVFGLRKGQVHIEQKMRDLLKSVVIKKTDNCFVALIGIEEQSQVHYAMPVKNMLYDALNYGSQVKDKAKQHRTEMDYNTSAEFLSGFKADDELIPVVTITLYLGENEWNGPRSLFDMYGDKVDDKIKQYLTDYKANVLVPREIENFDGLKTELRQLFEVLKVAGNEEEMEKVLKEDEKFKTMDNETAQAISIFARMDIKVDEEGASVDMCKAWDDHFMSGRLLGEKEGEKRGLSEGRDLGISEGRSQGRREEIFVSVQEGDYSVERGAEKLELSVEDFTRCMLEEGYKLPLGV